jgi:hypothetical protein
MMWLLIRIYQVSMCIYIYIYVYTHVYDVNQKMQIRMLIALQLIMEQNLTQFPYSIKSINKLVHLFTI